MDWKAKLERIKPTLPQQKEVQQQVVQQATQPPTEVKEELHLVAQGFVVRRVKRSTEGASVKARMSVEDRKEV